MFKNILFCLFLIFTLSNCGPCKGYVDFSKLYYNYDDSKLTDFFYEEVERMEKVYMEVYPNLKSGEINISDNIDPINVGLCYIEYNKIFVNETHIKNAYKDFYGDYELKFNYIQLKATILHELLHCDRKLKHLEGTIMGTTSQWSISSYLIGISFKQQLQTIKELEAKGKIGKYEARNFCPKF